MRAVYPPEPFGWGTSGSGAWAGMFPIFCARCRKAVAVVMEGRVSEDRIMFLTAMALSIGPGEGHIIHGIVKHPEGFQLLWDVARADQRLSEENFYAYLRDVHLCPDR